MTPVGNEAARAGCCKHCGAKLGLLQRLSKQDFCSPAHRLDYLRAQEQLALASLQEANRPVIEEEAPEEYETGFGGAGLEVGGFEGAGFEGAGLEAAGFEAAGHDPSGYVSAGEPAGHEAAGQAHQQDEAAPPVEAAVALEASAPAPEAALPSEPEGVSEPAPETEAAVPAAMEAADPPECGLADLGSCIGEASLSSEGEIEASPEVAVPGASGADLIPFDWEAAKEPAQAGPVRLEPPGLLSLTGELTGKIVSQTPAAAPLVGGTRYPEAALPARIERFPAWAEAVTLAAPEAHIPQTLFHRISATAEPSAAQPSFPAAGLVAAIEEERREEDPGFGGAVPLPAPGFRNAAGRMEAAFEPMEFAAIALQMTLLLGRETPRFAGRPPSPRPALRARLNLQSSGAPALLDPLPCPFGEPEQSWQPEL